MTQKKVEIKTVPELMRLGAETYEKKAAIYGDSYRQIGKVLHAMYPEPPSLDSEEAWVRLGLQVHIITKLVRDGNAFVLEKTLIDNPRDLTVYASMLEEIERESQ